jgi:hypothetical protein
MQDYPNETYLDIYEDHFPRRFYRVVCRDQNFRFAESFIKSIAVYRNERSEKILSYILNRKPFMSCPIDTGYIKEELVHAIWNNPCDAYIKIRKQVEGLEKRYAEYKKNEIELPPLEIDSTLTIDSTLLPKDTSGEPVRWW